MSVEKVVGKDLNSRPKKLPKFGYTPTRKRIAMAKPALRLSGEPEKNARAGLTMSTPPVSPLINEVNLPNFGHGRASFRPPVGMDKKFENLILKIEDCCGDSTDPGLKQQIELAKP